MLATAKWIIDVMEAWAPAKWAMQSDNVGLLVGDKSKPVNKVLTALDLSEDVLLEAVNGCFDFIIVHHPLISSHVQPVDRITSDTVLGKKIMTLISNDIGLFCAHTNLDVAPGGVNDLLFGVLGLIDKENLTIAKDSNYPTLGLVGQLSQPMALADFAKYVGNALNVKGIRYTGSSNIQISKVGLCGGGGANQQLAKSALEKKCNVYITGDIGYHFAMSSLECGLPLIDATHYATEIFIAEAIADFIKKSAAAESFSDFVVQSAQNTCQIFNTT